MTITGFSTALFSTWYFVDEMDLLFDCGDGACAGLLQKSRKVKHVFVSHADRDHLAGLLQFNQLNARDELSVYYPKDSLSFQFLAEFSAKFDPQVGGTHWVPLQEGDEVPIRKDLVVRAVKNRHVPTDGSQTKSLSYFVESVSRKLKPEHAGKPGQEIARIRNELGEEAITRSQRRLELVYSGDTPIETDQRYDQAGVLIHEATFLTSAELDPSNPRRNKHSSLEQVLEMVSRSEVQTLIVGHFSSRYDHEQILAAIKYQSERFGVEIPIHVVLPGITAHDVLQTTT